MLALAILALACSSPAKVELPDGNSGNITPATKAASVVTGDATSVTNTSALLSATYADAPSQGVYDRGVNYGLAAYDLSQQAGLNSDAATSGSFSVQLSSLNPGTTYYYQAYITVWSEADKKYVDVTGAVKNFTTTSDGGSGGDESPAGLQYLTGYEIPAIDLKDDRRCSGYGPETFGTTNWYNYLTSNENQMVVTHTYAYQGKQYRNWTALIDKDMQSPLWSAFVMHKDAYPDNGVGRWDKKGGQWTPDPAIPTAWQRSVASSSYSRGHFCASEYRQTVLESANAQTFYYTNQALQWQSNFNSGIWSSLETAVSGNAPSGRDTLYVVVGVMFNDPDKIISTNQGTQVLAPSHFYKCLMKCSFNESGTMTAAKACAYLFTNETHSGSYSQHITTIDNVEKQSGWDFYANIPKELQDAAEAQATSLW